MDLDNLFDAFEGGEKAHNVQEVRDNFSEAEKRKLEDIGEDVEAGGIKRRPLQGKMGLSKDGSSESGGPGKGTESQTPVVLTEGEESSTFRGDGTFIKSVSTW